MRERAGTMLRMVAVGLAAAVLAVGCSGEETSAPPAGSPSGDTLRDGQHQGWMQSITTTRASFRLVSVLSGREAVDAAKEDGHPLEDGSLPNDVYVKELGRTVTLPVAGDAGVRIMDCTEGCEEVGTTLEALASGQAKPYGGNNALFNFTVEDGAVVSLAEQYLP